MQPASLAHPHTCPHPMLRLQAWRRATAQWPTSSSLAMTRSLIAARPTQVGAWGIVMFILHSRLCLCTTHEDNQRGLTAGPVGVRFGGRGMDCGARLPGLPA